MLHNHLCFIFAFWQPNKHSSFMEGKQLLQPLLATTTSSAAAATGVDEHDADDNIKALSSNTSIIFRLLSVIFIGAISTWANIEASKGFDVTIINEAKDSPAGKRFDLFYISNDKATRMLLNTSFFVVNILYPHTNMNTLIIKKNVQHVTLRFSAGTNTTQTFTVDTTKSPEFFINISSSIMGEVNANVNYAIVSALQRGMARIWLWDGESRAPPSLTDGFVEYISMLAGFQEAENFVGGSGGRLPELISHICWDNKDPRVVAGFLDFCEVHNKGFIQRLNQGMRRRWDNRTVDDALGMEAEYLCDSYKKL